MQSDVLSECLQTNERCFKPCYKIRGKWSESGEIAVKVFVLKLSFVCIICLCPFQSQLMFEESVSSVGLTATQGNNREILITCK